MKHKISLILLLFVSSTLHAVSPLYDGLADSHIPAYAKAGNHQVGVTTRHIKYDTGFDIEVPGHTISGGESRPLTLEIWYPAKSENNAAPATYDAVTRTGVPVSVQGEAVRDAKSEEGTFPVVVISHGYTGYRSLMFYLGEHLASHGYVAVAIDHTDSTTGDVKFPEQQFSGFLSTLLHRGRDQAAALNYVSADDSTFANITDPKNASVIGYSMGAYGALNTAGGCYQYTPAHMANFGLQGELGESVMAAVNYCNGGFDTFDKRWKAAVAIAPWGQEQWVHSPESLSTLSAPVLFVAGDKDDVSGWDAGVKALYHAAGGQHHAMLVYEGARHNIAPHPAPPEALAHADDYMHYAETSWDNRVLNQINKHFVKAFLDCKQKEVQAACDMLPVSESSTLAPGVKDEGYVPWPGFEPRMATSMRFYQKQSK